MIIVKLMGGLGNQMFQYALGRYLAIKNNTLLRLDSNDFPDKATPLNFNNRTYGLNVFNVQAQIAAKKEIAAFFPDKTLFDRTLKKIAKLTGYQKVIFEKEKKFHPSILTTGCHAYLAGYWQSEKYFLPIGDLIRSDFTLKTDILNEIDRTRVLKEYKESILNTNSVSVHFRRGDYVNDFITNQNHGVCPEEYYQKATALVNLKISNPFYFLFSDEPEWLEKNFKPYQPYNNIKANAGYVDLYLMSLCKHNIIANSSFSWWGAWLNRNPDKIVIAPQKWFADAGKNKQTADLIPEGWIRL